MSLNIHKIFLHCTLTKIKCSYFCTRHKPVIPLLCQKGLTANNVVLFFTTRDLLLLYVTDALPTDEQVRVCPSIQDRKGWVWNKYIFDGGHWTFDATFSIAGRNTYGADGMVSEREGEREREREGEREEWNKLKGNCFYSNCTPYRQLKFL